MKLFPFIKWLFNFNSWQPHSKRYLIYIIIGGIIMYYLPVVYLGIVMASVLLLMWLDLTFDIIKDKYTEFLKEQKNEKI
tara:strand:+ start:252 stop:488 length:237 start_codon:yes stop_codon:yes gene_type:complete